MMEQTTSHPVSIFALSVSGAIVLASLLMGMWHRLWTKQLIPPVYISEPGVYQLRPYRQHALGNGSLQYPMTVQSSFDAIADAQILPVGCQEQFVMGDDGAAYFLDQGSLDTTRRVTDPTLLHTISLLPSTNGNNLVLLGGTVCFGQDGTTFVVYTHGLPTETRVVGTDTVTSVIAMQGDTLSSPLPIAREKNWPNPGCSAPLLVTRSGHLYLSCGDLSGQQSTMQYLDVDVVHETAVPMTTCQYHYDTSAAPVCN